MSDAVHMQLDGSGIDGVPASGGVEPGDRAAARPAQSGAAATDFSAPLGNNAKTPSRPLSKRQSRYSLRDGLRRITSLERVRKCGRIRVSGGVALMASDDHERVGLGGIATCGSVWVCPVCAGKVAAKRKKEVEQVVAYALDSGYEVSLLTLTMRHRKGQRLVDLWDSLGSAWAYVTSGRGWQTMRQIPDPTSEDVTERSALGLLGFVRATEVTHGNAGWHVHLHVLCITSRSVLLPVACRVWDPHEQTHSVVWRLPADIIADRWAAGLARSGMEMVQNRGGVDWDRARDADSTARYVAKFGQKSTPADRLSSETTLGQFKHGRSSSRAPFEILEDVLEDGLAEDFALWHEYEQVSHGKRALTFSHGLRAWAGLGAAQTDEELAASGPGDGIVAVIDAAGWDTRVQPVVASLLDVLQSDGPVAALEWLDARGVAYRAGSWAVMSAQEGTP